MRIALLGSTGQIGRGLVRMLSAESDLHLYARRPQDMQEWLDRHGIGARVSDLSAFAEGAFDLIINAIGAGVPGKIKAAGAGIIETTERFDRLCLEHVERGTAAAYIFLSTGRVYGPDYAAAALPDSRPLPLEAYGPEDAYPLAKRQAELRHRALAGARIADIRIFGYVSDDIGLDDDFLVSQMLRALVDESDFETPPRDFVRDYVGLEDLAELISRLAAAGVPNGEYDIVSARPTTKFEMLEMIAQDFGLRYAIEGRAAAMRCCDIPRAISRHQGARAVGHLPKRASLENVRACADAILRQYGRKQRAYAS
jgi:nucleoside-diphosphate-sugar epimerase